MKVLLTGAGLVGAYAARALTEGGHKVALYDALPQSEYAVAVVGREVEMFAGDVRDVEALSRAVEVAGSQVVIHTAGALRGSFDRDPFDSYSTNMYGTICVAEAARRAGVRRLVHCSSLAVYNFTTAASGEIREDHPTGPESLYDHSKLLSELALQPFCAAAGLDLVVLRLAGVYGAGRFAGGAWLGQKVQQTLREVLAGRAVEIDEAEWGVNEYLYVRDAAAALFKAATVPTGPFLTVNVGPGKLTSAAQIGHALRQVAPESEVVVNSDAQSAVSTYLRREAPLSTERANQALGYSPLFADIVDGMRDYASELSRLGAVL